MNNELKKCYDDLISQQRALRKEFQEKAKSLFSQTFEEFFKVNPGINAVIWTQYTPFFNDGDTCEFSIHSFAFTNATGDDLDEIRYEEYDGDNEEIWTSDNIKRTLNSDSKWAQEDKAKILAGPAIDVEFCEMVRDMIFSEEFEDVLFNLFGDHTKIIVTKDGIQELEFDHD